MKHYFKYLKYILEHKKNVFKVCWENKMYLHAFTHDLSKISPKEFFAYADWFHGNEGIKFEKLLNETSVAYKKEDLGKYMLRHAKYKKNKDRFEKAWQNHKDKNKHHWNHWSEKKNNNNGVIINILSFFNVNIQNTSEGNEIQEMPVKYVKQMICDWEAMSIKFGGTAQKYYLENYHNIKLHRDSRMVVEANLYLDNYNAPICGCNAEYWMPLDEIINHINKKEVLDDMFETMNREYNVDIYNLVKDGGK